jgi:hypothetical protein
MKTRRSIAKGKKGLPACVTFLNKYPEGKRVYYPTEKGKYGVYVFQKGPGIALALFTEQDDGTIHWHPRVVPNKKTGAAMFIYDLIEVHKAIVEEVSLALMEMAGKSFGTPTEIYRKQLAVSEGTDEEMEEDKLLKRHGI